MGHRRVLKITFEDKQHKNKTSLSPNTRKEKLGTYSLWNYQNLKSTQNESSLFFPIKYSEEKIKNPYTYFKK